MKVAMFDTHKFEKEFFEVANSNFHHDISYFETRLTAQTASTAGLDVYEEEENVFFEDLSAKVLQDDVLARLLTFPNVLVTSHQAFLTREALQKIATTTLQNITDFENGKPLKNEIKPK